MNNNITTDFFIELCKEKVKDFYRDDKIFHIDVALVWYSKTIQNHKCLMIARYPDNLYFEFTYNWDLNELYMDCYKKFDKKIYKVD